MTNDAIDRSADQAARTRRRDMRLLRFAGGDVQLAPEWPEEHPRGVTPTTLLDAFDEDTEVMNRPDLLGADGVRS